MTIEQAKKRLMANQREWGDSPPSQYGREARDSPSCDGTNWDDVFSALGNAATDALIMKDRESRRKPAPKVPGFVSCKGWSLDTLVAKSKNFHKVHRICWSKSTAEQIKEYDAAHRGKPLIVEGLHEHPKWITAEFNPEWLLEHSGSQEISARNVHDRTDKDLLLSDFIKNARATSHFVTPGEKERLYGKDVPCPSEWKKFLHTGAVIPVSLAPDGPDNVLNNLPKADRPETLMCYLGIGDTFTPCHKDLCASYGHNLMTYTENGGSSFWFMTETSSANAAAEFFHSVLEQELDHESHVVFLDELAKAPFNVYIAEQKLGDWVLVPPRSAHQVVNSGGLTIKTSWSRMTVDSLSLALRYELPLYRRVCRIETYRVKSTIYHTLRRVIRQGKRIRDGRESSAGSPNVNAKEMASILDTLLHLFDSTLKEEYTQEHKDIPTLSEIDKEDGCDIGQLACNFCGCDLFQSFFECTTCVKAVGQKRVAHGAGFNICPGCYAEGRSCYCEVMSPVQCRPPADLLKTRKQGIDLLEKLKGSKSGLPSEKELLADNRLGLFQAALVLRRMKAHPNAGNSKKCSIPRVSHDVVYTQALYCKKCHGACCFGHLAYDNKLHAAEALVAHDQDDTHAVHHECHKASRQRFASQLIALKREELGYIPDPRVQLVYLATTYSTCRPVCPNPSLRKSGYYDLSVWDTEPETAIDPPPDHAASTMTSSSAPAVSSQSSSTRPKRFVMDCVLLNRLPHPPKPKENPVTEVTRAEFDDRSADRPQRKIPKLPRLRKVPPGVRPTSPPPPPNRNLAASNSSTSKVILLESDTDDEPVAKRRRLPKPAPDLRFRKSQTAVSVADAYNTASSQNSMATLNLARHPPSSSSATHPPLRKPTKRKAASTAEGPVGHASASSSVDRNATSVTPPLSTADSQGEIETARMEQEQLRANRSSRRSTKRKAASERPTRRDSSPDQQGASAVPASSSTHSMQEQIDGLKQSLDQLVAAQTRQAGQIDGSNFDIMLKTVTALAGQSDTVKHIGDLVANLLTVCHQPPNTALTFDHGYSWPATSRARTRGWDSGFDDQTHHHRPAPYDNHPVHHDYRSRAHYSNRYSGPYFNAAARRSSANGPMRYERRSWPPEHGDRAQWEDSSPLRHHHAHADERRETRRRRPTRFSPPIPGNSLGVVRYSGPRSHEGNETGSEVTVTADGPAPNATVGEQPPALGRAREETASATTAKAKFFPVAARERANTPDQDWEAQYALDDAENA